MMVSEWQEKVLNNQSSEVAASVSRRGFIWLACCLFSCRAKRGINTCQNGFTKQNGPQEALGGP